MTNNRSDILIIGGGIIGVACAYELSRRGKKVTLVEKGEVGHGCSYGNAGWITPCCAMPLPMPGMMLQALKWLLDSKSPLYIQPRPSRLLIGWLWRFMRSMNDRKLRASVSALTELSKLSLDMYRQLDESAPGSFGFQQRGLLMVAQSQSVMAAVLQEMELVAGQGIPGQQMDAVQVRTLEPAIREGSVIGGAFFPNEAHAEPLATVAHMEQLAKAQGVQILNGVEVIDFVQTGGAVSSVLTTRGHLRAERFVLASGAWSGRLAAKLDLRLPMLSGKGYAVTVAPPSVMPKIPIMVLDRKVAITPRAGSLRLSGTLELVDLDESVTLQRVEAVTRGAASVLDLPDPPGIAEIWRGLRPCTPDGLPVIGPAPAMPNLIIATGHQMLGLLMAAGTARLVADLVHGEPTCVDPRPFRADRFA